jgi:hypothetical protein
MKSAHSHPISSLVLPLDPAKPTKLPHHRKAASGGGSGARRKLAIDWCAIYAALLISTERFTVSPMPGREGEFRKEKNACKVSGKLIPCGERFEEQLLMLGQQHCM